jgi:hypothetical protein
MPKKGLIILSQKRITKNIDTPRATANMRNH